MAADEAASPTDSCRCVDLLCFGVVLRYHSQGAESKSRAITRLHGRELDVVCQLGPQSGPSDADVAIVEFADFTCPYCGEFVHYVDSLRKLGRSVRVVYRHLPSLRNPHSVPAIRASECAASQGRFEGMHRALYAHADSLGTAPWSWFAEVAAVKDRERFGACMRSDAPLAVLHDDTVAARRLRVAGTPTLLIHSTRYDGLPVFDSLMAYVDRAATRKRPR